MLSSTQLAKLVASPSPGAIAYQAQRLLEELKRINDEEYPQQACDVRDVFSSLANYIGDELWELYDAENPLVPKGGQDAFGRLIRLGDLLHELYADLRYLWTSSPRQSPPAIQVALTELTDLYFPTEQNGRPVCLVRPQWKYNLTYVPVTWILREDVLLPDLLDPEGKFGTDGPDELLEAIWRRWRARLPLAQQKDVDENPPRQLAILSFAGIDTEDTLSYPLLAHELGHFIDYSYSPPLHVGPDLKKASKIKDEDLIDVLTQLGRHDAKEPKVYTPVKAGLVYSVSACLRELLADLLALRMMGFGFFVSHYEFLKTVAVWPQPKILGTGYPGANFRLSVVFKHLVDENFLHLRSFFKQAPAWAKEEAEMLLTFLAECEQRLLVLDKGGEESVTSPNGSSGGQQQLGALAEEAVIRALPSLNAVARRVVPDDRAAQLTARFFERIAKLKHDCPPSFPNEAPGCFAEILSAAWAYQLLYGEQREMACEDLAKKESEYRKSCRLIMKAIELMPCTRVQTMAPSTAPEDSLEGPSKPGVLSATGIRRRLRLPLDDSHRLEVIPLRKDAVQAASLDVHLGNWFAIARRTRLKGVRLGDKADEQLLMTLGREEIFVPAGKPFLVHPGDFVLGATQEFLALPLDVMAFVEGLSGLGRRGLIVATATQIAPGFHGVIVLELANTGTVPLEITPGMAVAQVVLQTMDEPVKAEDKYHGRYYCQIKP